MCKTTYLFFYPGQFLERMSLSGAIYLLSISLIHAIRWINHWAKTRARCGLVLKWQRKPCETFQEWKPRAHRVRNCLCLLSNLAALWGREGQETNSTHLFWKNALLGGGRRVFWFLGLHFNLLGLHSPLVEGQAARSERFVPAPATMGHPKTY